MDVIIDWLISFVSQKDNVGVLAVLAGSALVEYVFPPFPGDTITLFGAVLITAYDWSFGLVFGAVMLGSIAGSMIDFYIGLRFGLARARLGSTRVDRLQPLIDKFRRHGPAYLVINRFLPGIRALFFVAAGMAGMRAWHVLVYGAISAALWNLGLIAAGSLIGANFETLAHWIGRYTVAVWILLGVVVAILSTRALLARRRARREAAAAAEPPG